MIDFHCHIDLYPKPQIIIRKCIELEIFVLSVTTTPSAFEVTKSICDESEFIKTALGLHPQLAAERENELDLFDSLLEKTDFVGEIGLDGSPELKGSWSQQEKVFRHILGGCSKIGGRIISIHSRRASSQVLTQLQRFPDCGIPVLHWFSGPIKDVRLAIDIGCWFSIGPAMVSSENGLRICKEIPTNRILTESDGPFVTIHERAAFPWDIQIVESELAKIWNKPNTEVKLQLDQNKSRILKSFVD